MTQLKVLNRPGAYSLVQLCPDPQRMETATVGVVIFSPEWEVVCEAKVSRDFSRAREFFGPTCPPEPQLLYFLKNLEERLKTERRYLRTFDDFENLCASLSGVFLLSKPRYAKLGEPSCDLEEIYHQVVTAPEKKSGKSRREAGPAIPALDRFFHSPRVEGRIKFKKEVIVPLTERKLTVPYAYLNGSLNLVKPVIFYGDEKVSAINAAKQLGTDGLFLKKAEQDHHACQLVVVARFQDLRLQEAVSHKIRSILGELATDYYTTDQLGELEQKVEREAKPIDDEDWTHQATR